MKTNKLMTAFALSAMFAACSQDAELNETIAKNDYSNIPMVEANFTVNTDVESRMATKFGWEVGDKVGFAWLGSTEMVNGNAYQNNPLYCNDAKNAAFSAEGMFYIGKYFAYMPYTEGNHTVEPIKFNVTGQPLTTNADDLAKHAIYISPEVYELEKKQGTAADNADKLPSGIGKNLPLTIARVSNAATINLAFANADALTDLKVYGVSLNTNNTPASFTYAPTTSVNASSWTGQTLSATFTSGAIAATSKDGIAVENNELTVYMLAMGNAATAATELEVVISTNYGDVTVDLDDTYGNYSDPCITFLNGEEEAQIGTTNLFNEYGSAGSVDVYVDMANVAYTGGDVATQEELMQKLNLLVVSEYKEDVTFNIVPETANRDNIFAFTDFTLPEGLKAKVKLTADATSVANGFVFNGSTLINKVIELGANAKVNGTITVNYLENESEEALTTLTVTSGKTLTIANEAVMYNDGVIAGAITTAGKTSTKAAGKYVSNADEAKHTGTFTNNGEIQWIEGTLPQVADATLVYANVTDFATLTKASTAGVFTARFVENATFGNNGLNLNSNEFANIEYIEIYSDVTINVTSNGVTGNAVNIQFSGLYNDDDAYAIKIMEDASLTVVSDTKDNAIDFANAYMSLATGAELSLTKVTFKNLGGIANKGNIVTTGSSLTAPISGTGSNSSVN